MQPGNMDHDGAEPASARCILMAKRSGRRGAHLPLPCTALRKTWAPAVRDESGPCTTDAPSTLPFSIYPALTWRRHMALMAGWWMARQSSIQVSLQRTVLWATMHAA